jgi:hypothetical protein
MRWWKNQKRHASADDVPAYFLEALLTTDIPPYLTDALGVTKQFPHDPLATKLAEDLDRILDSDTAS